MHPERDYFFIVVGAGGDACGGTDEAPMKLKIFAITAVLAAGVSGAAMAQYAPYACPAGYTYYSGACRPAASPGYYGNPVTGAVSGEAAGAASGYATGGPVGAVVGGALGVATGTVAGTANTVSGATGGCSYGYHYYNGYCYPNR
jgi:hypothetical protein